MDFHFYWHPRLALLRLSFPLPKLCIDATANNIIRQAEADPGILGCSDHNVVVIGACAGLLPAAVAAVSRTITDVIHVGLELVAISLRLATEMSRRSRMIEPAPGFWGHTVIGLSPKDIEASLEDFHLVKVTQSNKYTYIEN